MTVFISCARRSARHRRILSLAPRFRRGPCAPPSSTAPGWSCAPATIDPKSPSRRSTARAFAPPIGRSCWPINRLFAPASQMERSPMCSPPTVPRPASRWGRPTSGSLKYIRAWSRRPRSAAICSGGKRSKIICVKPANAATPLSSPALATIISASATSRKPMAICSTASNWPRASRSSASIGTDFNA